MLFHTEVAEGLFLLSSDASGPNEDGRSLLPGKATANSYLVIGGEKALLFDLAVNEPGLARYVRTLTEKPVMPVLSHGHVDHIYHLEDVPEVWLHPADLPLLRGKGIGSRRVKPMPAVHELADGDTIDLGGRVLDVIHIPGHTLGSILLLDRNTRTLLSGDTFTRRLLYGISGYVPLEQFCDRLRALEDRPFDRAYSAHDRCALPKEHLSTMLDGIRSDLPTAKKTVSIPLCGKLRCFTRGTETDLCYFDMAYWDKGGRSSGPQDKKA